MDDVAGDQEPADPRPPGMKVAGRLLDAVTQRVEFCETAGRAATLAAAKEHWAARLAEARACRRAVRTAIGYPDTVVDWDAGWQAEDGEETRQTFSVSGASRAGAQAYVPEGPAVLISVAPQSETAEGSTVLRVGFPVLIVTDAVKNPDAFAAKVAAALTGALG